MPRCGCRKVAAVAPLSIARVCSCMWAAPFYPHALHHDSFFARAAAAAEAAASRPKAFAALQANKAFAHCIVSVVLYTSSCGGPGEGRRKEKRFEGGFGFAGAQHGHFSEGN
jgi:hypothetical protein